ncbi:MAG: hypothetical protein OXC83_08300 [Chloroflexi bacterium]|nr:hypothetical protein [Chloroflexota bacterium]
MKLSTRSTKSKLTSYSMAIAIATFIAVIGALGLATATNFGSATVIAQEPTGLIKEITPSTSNLLVNSGDTVWLSINVIGLQDVRQQSLGSDVTFNWSATGGDLPPNKDGNTSVRYKAPDSPGNYVVTVSATSNCRGTCTATIDIRVRRPGSTETVVRTPVNPPGEIPTVLADADGNQYGVFTPEEGGTFTGDQFWINAMAGTVPNAEYIGVRMFENGSASNAGMSGHRYTLGGTKYSVAVIDSERNSVASYRLNATVEICIPVPMEMLSQITKVEMIATSDDGTELTVLSSSVRVVPTLTICGNTSSLPVNVAAGIPGTPPMPEPTPVLEPALPVTGGAGPSSTMVLAWTILIGFALIATGMFAVYRRRRQN